MKLLCLTTMVIMLLSACDNEKQHSITSKQPEIASSSSANSPKPETIDVVINAQARAIDKKHIEISGNTNLPEQTELNITVEDSKGQWRSQAKAFVTDGKFSVQNLEIAYGLTPDKYKIDITQIVPPLQKASVKKLIGDHGEYLTGKLVDDSLALGKCARYTIYLTSGSQSEISSTRIQEENMIKRMESKVSSLISKGLAMDKYRTEHMLSTSPRCGQLMREYMKIASDIRSEADNLRLEYAYLKFAAIEVHNCVLCTNYAKESCIKARNAINNKAF